MRARRGLNQAVDSEIEGVPATEAIARSAEVGDAFSLESVDDGVDKGPSSTIAVLCAPSRDVELRYKLFSNVSSCNGYSRSGSLPGRSLSRPARHRLRSSPERRP